MTKKALAIVLAPRFVAELKQQIEHIAKRNKPAAATVEARIRIAIRRLGRFPELGRRGRIEGTRELTVPRTPYIVAYRVRGDVVEIAALLHAAQAWPTTI